MGIRADGLKHLFRNFQQSFIGDLGSGDFQALYSMVSISIWHLKAAQLL